ncbi:hypothetical protein SF12_03745 [Streptomyces sp. MBRL 601]|nr:hypothetical protein SF12_03745 [Streptomyces sp. MBRL 601]
MALLPQTAQAQPFVLLLLPHEAHNRRPAPLVFVSGRSLPQREQGGRTTLTAPSSCRMRMNRSTEAGPSARPEVSRPLSSAWARRTAAGFEATACWIAC